MGMIEIGSREELNRIYNKPANRKLKRGAIAAIAISIILISVGLIWADQLSGNAMLLIRGFAGLFAIVFAVLYATFVYRVYRELLKP